MSVPSTFRALLVSKEDGQLRTTVTQLPLEKLPKGDVVVRVAYSSVNYKDAMAVTGNPGVVKNFPHVPGIDAAGIVVSSEAPEWRAGDQVIVSGYELGAGVFGGYSEYIRVPSRWIVPLPSGLTPRESMVLGTAGFTAGQSVAELIKHEIDPRTGEIVVTGASGGVGSLAVSILSKLGYRVTAVSGKPEASEFLTGLGAQEVVPRDAVDDDSNRPLLSARWAGAVDTAGGNVLATILRSTKVRGCVTACGLVAGVNVPLTVFPFILRGVKLIGIDSAWCPQETRVKLWSKLSHEWKPTALDTMVQDITLDQVDHYAREILAGQVMGRIVVRIAD